MLKKKKKKKKNHLLEKGVLTPFSSNRNIVCLKTTTKNYFWGVGCFMFCVFHVRIVYV